MKLTLLATFVFAFIFQANSQDIQKQNIAISTFIINNDPSLGIIVDHAFYDSLYNSITSYLQDSAGFQFIKNSDLKGKLPFGPFNYPVSTVKKASGSGVAEQYIKMIVNIRSDGMVQSKSNSISSNNMEFGTATIKAKIKIVIQIDIFDKLGTDVKEVEVEASSADKIYISRESVNLGAFSLTKNDEQISENQGFQVVLSDVISKLGIALK